MLCVQQLCLCRMAPELFPSVPGAMSGINRREAEDRVTEKVRGSVFCAALQLLGDALS